MRRLLSALGIGLFVILLAACGSAAATAIPTSNPESAAGSTTSPAAATSVPESNPPATSIDVVRKVGSQVGDLAPEVGGIDAWINSDPLTIASLRGKVVLVDFWTYTCINCIRTFPFLKLWNARYADDGLVILGIHTPEFDFEKDHDNVVTATQTDGIVWPVAQDNDYVTWRNFSNRFWPAKYLIDKDGVIRYTHFGEGDYAETETQIRKLLLEAGAEFRADEMVLPEDQQVDPVFLTTRNAEVTRELYAGYDRNRSDFLYGSGGYAGQRDYYLYTDEVGTFQAPDELLPHQIYFQGLWHIGPDSSRQAGATGTFDDFLTIVYSSVSVHAVLTSESDEPYKVRLTVDGEYLTAENKGSDVIIGEDGESYLWVTEPKLYNVIENPGYVRRETLKMASDSDDFGLFAFTFGVYQKTE